MEKNLIYVYCISDSNQPHDSMAGIPDLKALRIGNFNVYVKYVSDSEFSEENLKKNLNDIQWLDTNARDHLRVIGQIMENESVIPFKFGTIFLSEERLNKFISDYSSSLSENFQRIEGREEWSVRIYCDRKMMSQQIDRLSEEASSLEKQIQSSLPGKAFLLRRKKTELIENETDRLINQFGQEYYNKFKELSNLTSLNNILPEELTGRTEKMILNAAFLVPKRNVESFMGKADSLLKKDDNLGFSIETTGPWPPFSFISLKELY